MGNNNVTFENNSSKFISESDKKKKAVLLAIGEKAVSIWRKIITRDKVVDTGRFRNSTTFEAKDNEVMIGSNVNYAPFLETGSSRGKARPTLRESILAHKDTYKQLVMQMWKS